MKESSLEGHVIKCSRSLSLNTAINSMINEDNSDLEADSQFLYGKTSAEVLRIGKFYIDFFFIPCE